MDNLEIQLQRLTVDKLTEHLNKLSDSTSQMSITEQDIGRLIKKPPPHFVAPREDSRDKKWMWEPDRHLDTAVDLDQTNGGFLSSFADHLQMEKRNSASHETAMSIIGQDIVGAGSMVVHDAYEGGLKKSIYLHIKSRVLYDSASLVFAVAELRYFWGVDIRWLAMAQIGLDLIQDAAKWWQLDLSWKGPSRSQQELYARSQVYKVKVNVFEAFCWPFQHWDEVKNQRKEYIEIFGGRWSGDDKMEERFQPFVEGDDNRQCGHTRPFYVDLSPELLSISSSFSKMIMN